MESEGISFFFGKYLIGNDNALFEEQDSVKLKLGKQWKNSMKQEADQFF